MNRQPNLPSRPAPSQPFATYSPYQKPDAAPPRPEIIPPTQHHRPRDTDPSPNNAQQLPSLRTLLEPELLDNKFHDLPSRSGGAAFLAQGTSERYGSNSPTLKRRHDFDGYSPEKVENNAITSRIPQVNRYGPTNLLGESQSLSYPAQSSTPHSYQSEFPRHASIARATHMDPAGKIHQKPSTVSTMSALSNPIGGFAGQPQHDDPMDMIRPVRRRTDVSSRAPIRSSRCVGQREVPGEGRCYIYEDGSYCRAVIDGEPVNPSWGITKAGKPRKRLAQACLTCREKKIKCEPGYPKCHQCAKSQRACRGGLNQAGMSNASGETSPSSSSALFKNPSTELVSPVAGPDKPKALEEHRDPSRTVEAWNAGSPFKHRNFRPTSVATSRDMSVHSVDSDWSGSMNAMDPDDPRRGSHQDHLAVQWEQDPYETDARLTMHLLDLYFLHAGRATYGMFPRKPFSTWVETNREKTQDHLMLLYSVLAMGSIFSNDLDKRTLGKRFAAIAAYGTEKRFGKFTLQLCQSRLMLALYNFARGKSQEAWDFCGAGLRAISALKLNTEEGIQEVPDLSPELDYGFDRRTLEECCRRTFWSGFLMDVSSTAFTATTTLDLMHQQRYNGFCGGTLCVINIEDTFLRLPCLETLYEASNPCDTPFFDFELLSRQAPPGPPLGDMAYLTLISAIWGDVLTFTSRAVRRPDNGYERLYESFYSTTYERLETWQGILPANLRYSAQNLDSSIVEGYAGTFISLHALYHTTIIRLNRHVRLWALSTDQVSRNIDQSFRNASHFLSIMHSLAPVNRRQRLPPNSSSEFLFSTPFPGYALMLSVDVLSAAGTVSTLNGLIETVDTTLSCIEELANFWASARAQQKAITKRLQHLIEIASTEEQGIRNGSFGQYWRVKDSLETAFGNDDVMYKARDPALFEVVGGLTGH
ncbi:hypothetical protein BU24DRAFT_430092 [Aaosphaeria arxii CBS 175.79]|uniref:Zn(2)-C6 fungal-type domain-containing protein n=1 Tax=Aaosphaeria arxii CBS 175.79 TaxID=1450172 RepID=A0A6A5Y8R6_9PLEO|nr:uncharacterized protein BU24DRAFT_430092 [Aaosphaeria arxii CBS 175.79]KAF2021397.1 hypothetical protein BU24DRAFT_430092 [Aaosphaeria arxii CBS 175.79]